MTTTNYSFGDYAVSFAVDADDPLGELEDLHICHLGMRFISRREIPVFGIYEFSMTLKPRECGDDEARLNCCGVVVSSEPENGGYRTVIHFADLDKTAAGCLERITKKNNMRCDYCANG
jgi:hypothetical protein